MKKFKDIREQQYPEVRKHLKKIGKGGQVSYTDHSSPKPKGKKPTKTGTYGGMMRMGAHSYAKIEPHHGRGPMTALPIHQADNIRHVQK